jgi:capsular exopolysaccharide synthesis family protein
MPAPELPLREHARTLWRRRRLALAFFASVVGAAAVASGLATPRFTAATTLLIEPRGPDVIDIHPVLGESVAPDYEYYNTQHALLRSRSLAARVVRELELDREPVFLAMATSPLFELRAAVRERLHRAARALAGSPGAEARDPLAQLAALLPPFERLTELVARGGRTWETGLEPEDLEAAWAEVYLEGLSVAPLPGSRLVQVAFTSPDPALAARVANAHARAFVEQGLEMRARAGEEARAFLESSLRELRGRVGAAEAALGAYRREHGIVSLDDRADVVIQRFADLSARLTEAQAERIAREAERRLVGERSRESLPAVLASPLVHGLKQELARLESRRASLATRFKAGYPRLAQLRSEIDETRRRLDREIASLAAGVESAFLAARSREAELRAELETQKVEALRLKDAAIEFALLRNDVETSRRLYDAVQARVQETQVASELRTSNVFVIDQATQPLLPATPRTARNLGLAALLGLLGGVGLAFLSEALDDRLRGPLDVERSLGVPSLGAVPRGRRAEPAEGGFASEAPAREAVEAFRAIRTALLQAELPEGGRVLLVTSAARAEGRTTVALHTALALAGLGGAVLLVDADLRDPAVHRRLGVRAGPGLGEILAGQETRLVRLEVHKQQLYLLRAGGRTGDPAELLGAPRMRELLRQLRRRFVWVVIDAAALLPTSDVDAFAGLVDGVVLVVDRERTTREVVREACRRLERSRAHLVGVVLNRAEPAGGPAKGRA